MLARAVPAGTLAFLRSWMATPLHTPLAQEWELLRQHDAAWSVAPYPVVLVTVDCIVKCGEHVLLIRRGHSPGKGLHAVPGGFLESRETTLQSALRELEEETHLALPPAELLACLARTEVFDRPDRSQRGRTITHGHFFDLGDRQPLPGVRADDDGDCRVDTDRRRAGSGGPAAGRSFPDARSLSGPAAAPLIGAGAAPPASPQRARVLAAARAHHAAVRLDVHDQPCGIEGYVGVGQPARGAPGGLPCACAFPPAAER